jgi:hypothetical protein
VSDFTAIWLPSAESSARILTTENIGIASLDFAIDPTQDLVVFLHKYPDEVGNFDCRSLSTFQPHPLACSPRLSFDLRDSNFRRIFLQIADDVIGLLFRTSGELTAGALRLVLFNWRTGMALVVSCILTSSIMRFLKRCRTLLAPSFHPLYRTLLFYLLEHTFWDASTTQQTLAEAWEKSTSTDSNGHVDVLPIMSPLCNSRNCTRTDLWTE